jgi:hypothetical protein
LVAVALSLSCIAALLPVEGFEKRTRVVVLGVAHSNNSPGANYQPAVFRAFYDKVAPLAIGIDWSPEQ